MPKYFALNIENVLIAVSIILSFVVIYLHANYTDKEIADTMEVSASPWMSYEQNNLIQATLNPVNAPYQPGRYNARGVNIIFDNTCMNYGNLPEGANTFTVTTPGPCQNMSVSTWWWKNRNLEGKSERKDTTIDCSRFGYDDMRNYQVVQFDLGNYDKPRTRIAAYPISAFIPNHPNEVLFVDIHDNIAYKGNIIVERLNAPPGARPQIVEASDSGVTSLSISIDKPTDFKITAGEDILNVTFTPQKMPFILSYNESQFNDYQLDNINIRRKIEIIPIEERKEIIVDYYDGYAWISRQVVPASVNSVELTPKYKNTKYPGIIYARFSMVGFEKEEYTQTIPLITPVAKQGESSNLLKRINASLTFGAIYQEYFRLTRLNAINPDNIPGHRVIGNDAYNEMMEVYQSPDKQDAYEIFSVAKLLSHFITGDDNPIYYKYRIARRQIFKYLLTRLTELHHPAIVKYADTFEQETAILNAQKQKEHRKAWLFTTLMAIAGFIGFTLKARHIRIRRQQAWLERSSHGWETSEMPGVPIWMTLLLAGLFLGVILSSFMYCLWL